MKVHRPTEEYFNDPNIITFEESLLNKLLELAEELKNFSYPSTLSGQRGQLVQIAESICHYNKLYIDCMRRNDYQGYKNHLNQFRHAVDSLFQYYHSLV